MILTGGPRCRGLLWHEFFEETDPYGIRSCGPMNTVIDLGAHCGMFSLMARFLMPQARIFAIEPDVGNFEALKSNAAHLHIDVQNVALGDGRPVALLNRHVRTVSMRYDHTHSGPTSGVFDHPDVPDIVETIPSAKLQDLWTQWNPTGRIFVKMDMEGAEHYIVGDPEAERCLESCMVIGGEIHAHPGGPTLDDYRTWLHTRYDSMFDVQFSLYKRARNRLAQLKMTRRGGA